MPDALYAATGVLILILCGVAGFWIDKHRTATLKDPNWRRMVLSRARQAIVGLSVWILWVAILSPYLNDTPSTIVAASAGTIVTITVWRRLNRK